MKQSLVIKAFIDCFVPRNDASIKVLANYKEAKSHKLKHDTHIVSRCSVFVIFVATIIEKAGQKVQCIDNICSTGITGNDEWDEN